MGEATEGEILMLILVGLHERHAVQRGIWARTQDFIYDQWNTRNSRSIFEAEARLNNI